ncbi:hypothetical protein DXV75_02590 [Alteromonas aestuariivivens]|uniref:Glycoside hydrolase family 42 N-terminal domain-containing protein n=1 Tax=Alteromonas aestuariivivens TaxID=1938339 RepID=A0A3D8MFR8_9ALTE|nr:hypothetical protein [Alteromonas aestuariivivens]RDV29354.1 hypothetical protein DXV75_02590 [Alteromonas aestuariivivens]
MNIFGKKTMGLVPVAICAAIAGYHAVTWLGQSAHASEQVLPKSISERVADKQYPAIFQAWNPLDMPHAFPDTEQRQFLDNAAKHSLLWEEPVSQLGFGTRLVIGLEWDHQYPGLATGFTRQTLTVARKNLNYLHDKNPNLVTLFEIRWRDAPGSYLPEDSDFWARDDQGNRVLGWDGGPEPYYMLNYENPDFQKRLGEQAKAVMASGVYDGVMLDWSGYLPIVRQVREHMGEAGLLLVNIHDEIDKGKQYQDYINGAFMECAPNGRTPENPKKLCSWESMAEALSYYEQNFRKPTINALEAWGARSDDQAMRALTTLGLTHSDGYVLFADPNPLPTPDHMHDWYGFWDASLGKPVSTMQVLPNGAVTREFENGLVIYNPQGNGAVTLELNQTYRSQASGTTIQVVSLSDQDGDILLDK